MGWILSKIKTALHRKPVTKYCKYDVEISAAGKWDLSALAKTKEGKTIALKLFVDWFCPTLLKKDPMQHNVTDTKWK